MHAAMQTTTEPPDAAETQVLANQWRDKIEVVRLKRGRSLTTAILHVQGNVEPPVAALFLAVADWQRAAGGQVVRRPDENGKMVYWLNAVNEF